MPDESKEEPKEIKHEGGRFKVHKVEANGFNYCIWEVI